MIPVYILFICVLFFLYVWVLYNVPVLAVGVRHLKRTSLRKKKPESNPEKLPTFSIVVPVKDEERVVDRLLKALFKVDYPPEKRDMYRKRTASALNGMFHNEHRNQQYQSDTQQNLSQPGKDMIVYIGEYQHNKYANEYTHKLTYQKGTAAQVLCLGPYGAGAIYHHHAYARQHQSDYH